VQIYCSKNITPVLQLHHVQSAKLFQENSVAQYSYPNMDLMLHIRIVQRAGHSGLCPATGRMQTEPNVLGIPRQN